MRRFLVPLACAALFPFPCQAQAQSGLTLERAMDIALTHNPALSAARDALQAQDGAVRQAGAVPNPTLGFNAEDTRAATRTTQWTLSQTIELGGKRQARVALAERERDVVAMELEADRAEVRASTIQAFFDVLIAQERVQVAQQSLELTSSGADAASRRVAAGKVAPVEETRARVATATARIELRLAQADLAAALRALGAVMGQPEAGIGAVDGRPDTLPPLPDLNALADRIPSAPAIRRAQLQALRADAAFQLERARAIPDVTVGVGAQRAPDVGRTQPLISVSVPIPLFDRNQGAQWQALRHRDAAQAQARATELRLRTEVLQSLDQLQARQEEIETLRREVLPQAQTAHDAARRGFELGKFGFLEVLDAQRTFLQARGQYLAALSQAHRLSAEIERRLGADVDHTRR